MDIEKKRLFFGLEVISPWPEKLPSGRLLKESSRHLTVAFIGDTDYSKIKELLPSIPPFPRTIGLSGRFDESLFLPPHHPHVVAWHVHWYETQNIIENYHHQLVEWLHQHNIAVDKKDHFLPHVTLCRNPFTIHSWKEAFLELPLITQNLHLYESLGSSNYQSCWSYPIQRPFQEIDHTADIAFEVLAYTFNELFLHAVIALAFHHAPILDHFEPRYDCSTIDQVITYLNELISKVDTDQGCPFKAISYHGHVEKIDHDILKWEMIVDF